MKLSEFFQQLFNPIHRATITFNFLVPTSLLRIFDQSKFLFASPP